MTTLLAVFGMGPQEMLIVGVLAVLLFGKRLPEVARSFGKSITEFKKGMHGLEDEIHSASTRPTSSSHLPRYGDGDDRDDVASPKFEPPGAKDDSHGSPPESPVAA